MTPVVVIVRDRVTVLQQCLQALEASSYGLDIHLVDHGSTWPPMLDWLHVAPYPVHWCGDQPPRALWDWDGLPGIVKDSRYVVTDPDVVLDCPDDWLCRMADELAADANGYVVKVGLGLRVDDLPDTPLARRVVAWETPFWRERTPTGCGFRAPVDTTLALYQPLTVEPRFQLHPAARMAAPYLVRHLPWYDDPATRESGRAEDAYYRAHVRPGASHWAHGGWEHT